MRKEGEKRNGKRKRHDAFKFSSVDSDHPPFVYGSGLPIFTSLARAPNVTIQFLSLIIPSLLIKFSFFFASILFAQDWEI